jgi:hypothetical protein
VAFDTSLLEVVDADAGSPGIQVSPGSLLVPPLFQALNTADNVAGTVGFAATQLHPTAPAYGSGTVAVIRFRARGAGTSPLSFTFTQLSTRDGDLIGAPATDGTVATAPPESPTLSIAKLNATDARLTWTTSSGPDEYRLYRDTYAYFAPAEPAYATVSGGLYDDLGALGSVADNYFYVVRAACANGFASADSNRVGEFDYALTVPTVPGTRKYNLIGFPLNVSGVTTADQLAAFVGGVYMVMRYDAPLQTIVWRIPGVGGTNFGLVTGGAYYLYVDPPAPSVVTFVGGVPVLGSVQFALTRPPDSSSYRYNYITVPLQKTALTTADQLAADIGGVYMVLRYDAPAQTLQWRIPGVGGTNFPVRVGYPYILQVKNTAPPVWP